MEKADKNKESQLIRNFYPKLIIYKNNPSIN
jgi:hypothetical protein